MSVRKFIELNKQKVLFSFTVTSIAFLCFVISLLGYLYINGNIPELTLVVISIIAAGIIFPLLIISFGYFDWNINRSLREKALQTFPFRSIENLGFENYKIYDKSKWKFTEEIKKGVINGFYIYCNREEKSNVLLFTAAVYHDSLEKLNNDHYDELNNKLRSKDIELSPQGPTKRYDLKKLTVHSEEDLNSQLKEFTNLLHKEGFKPLKYS